jgi:hypothetical protein
MFQVTFLIRSYTFGEDVKSGQRVLVIEGNEEAARSLILFEEQRCVVNVPMYLSRMGVGRVAALGVCVTYEFGDSGRNWIGQNGASSGNCEMWERKEILPISDAEDQSNV